VVAETCDEMVVMYAGHVVEKGRAAELFARPRHPYTHGLLRSVPSLQPVGKEGGKRRRLTEIPGMVPRLDQLPPGCRFQDRCASVQARCRTEAPPLEPDPIDPRRLVRCFFPTDSTSAAA
jgi:peptide/nickel transport system ATP-binding protein